MSEDAVHLGQEELYDFPYHHLPHYSRKGPLCSRRLDWGMDYMHLLEVVLELLKGVSPQSLCDIGCGDGRLAAEASRLEGIGVLSGLEISERASSFARGFAPRAAVTTGDFSAMDETYEAVTCIEVLEHVSDADTDAFVDDLVRLVSPGGTLIVSVPSKNAPVSPKHYRHYSLADLDDAFARQKLAPVDVRFVGSARSQSEILSRFLSNRLYVLDVPRLNRRRLRRLERMTKADDEGVCRSIVRVYRVL